MSSQMEATVDLLEGMTFRGHTETGHTVALDLPVDAGGADSGPKPIEMLLVTLGGCTGMDVISILRKMRQDVTSYRVRVHGERAEEHPKVFTRIVVEHVVRGRGLNEDSVRRAVELSSTRYCPVSAMLGKSVQLGVRYRLVDEESSAETVGELALTGA